MILFIAAQATRLFAGDPADGTDHTQEIAIVAQFLARRAKCDQLSNYNSGPR